MISLEDAALMHPRYLHAVAALLPAHLPAALLLMDSFKLVRPAHGRRGLWRGGSRPLACVPIHEWLLDVTA